LAITLAQQSSTALSGKHRGERSQKQSKFSNMSGAFKGGKVCVRRSNLTSSAVEPPRSPALRAQISICCRHSFCRRSSRPCLSSLSAAQVGACHPQSSTSKARSDVAHSFSWVVLRSVLQPFSLFPITPTPTRFAGTGFFYVTRKNPTQITRKLAFRKYDPIVRQHVVFEESKMK
jgi:large subunit ribosomal protein L33